MGADVFQMWIGLEAGPLRFVFSGFALTLGMLVGSFLNVVIYRVPLGRSIVLPPSACTVCNTPLAWYQNIPVISYLALAGRCRFCGTPYSFRYAALEFITGLFFLACQLWGGFFSWFFLKSAVLFCFCLVVFFIDLDHWIIPDGINLAGVLVGFAFSLVSFLDAPEVLVEMLGPRGASLVWSMLGSLAGLAFFWAIQVVGLILVKQEAMGGGDVKFAALIGAFLGPMLAIWSFLLSFFLGALFAVPLVVLRRGGGKDPIPFGTFMAIAAVFFQVVDYGRLVDLFDSYFLWGGSGY